MDAGQLSGAPVRADHHGTNVMPFPAIKPGHHLAPIALGAPGPKQRVIYDECPDFCTQSHVDNYVHFLDDVTHNGDASTISVPSFLFPDAAVFQWSARVSSDPAADDPKLRAAHVVLEGDTGIDAYLTPDMGDDVADQLEKLAAKLREDARTARLHNQHEAVAA